MHRVDSISGEAGEEPCRCPQCSYSRTEIMNTKSVVALVYGLVAVLMAYVMHALDEVASFSLFLTAIFAFFYFGMSQIDVWQRRGAR